MRASLFISYFTGSDSHFIKLEFMFSGTVMAGKPYIIDKLNAVVSYIIDEPSRRLDCLSFTRTASSISASNSIIAARIGASGCRLGIIKLPTGIEKFSTISPDCFSIFFTKIGFSFL